MVLCVIYRTTEKKLHSHRVCWQQCRLNWHRMTQELPNLFIRSYASIAMKVYHTTHSACNRSPRTSSIQSSHRTRVTASSLRSPHDVLPVVTKLRTNSSWHVERCILFWWRMVSTVRVHEQPRPHQFGDIEREYYTRDKRNSANNADKRHRKCCEKRVNMYFGSGRTIRIFIIRLPCIFPCTVQYWFYINFLTWIRF